MDRNDTERKIREYCDIVNIYKRNNVVLDIFSDIACSRWSGQNLIFIYGDSGFFKTELLCDLYLKFMLKQPKMEVVYIQAFNFINNNIKAFINLDLLLFDEFEDLVWNIKSQFKLYHIIKMLNNKDKLVILAGIYHPGKYINYNRKLFKRINRGRIIKIK